MKEATPSIIHSDVKCFSPASFRHVGSSRPPAWRGNLRADWMATLRQFTRRRCPARSYHAQLDIGDTGVFARFAKHLRRRLTWSAATSAALVPNFSGTERDNHVRFKCLPVAAHIQRVRRPYRLRPRHVDFLPGPPQALRKWDPST